MLKMSFVQKYRDVQLIEWQQEKYLAIACDISAYIGPKEEDIVKVDALTAGYYGTIVPLMELLSIGAKPISVTDTLGVEMNPTGLKIIEGVKKAMVEADIPQVCLSGSTEDNMPTRSTSVGVTVVAELEKKRLKAYEPKAGQEVWLVGLPKMGSVFLEEEILGNMGEVLTIAVVKHLRGLEGLGHMLPIGSKGIGQELDVLLALNHLKINLQQVPVDMTVSAGPSTCLLMTCRQGLVESMKEGLGLPLNYLGILEKR